MSNPHAVALGQLGGRAGKGRTSPAKAAAARANGQKGGRPMTFRAFQQAAERTHDAPFPERERLPVMALGLCGEAGEVADLIKKHLWHGKDDITLKLCDELGDVLWYVADLATSLGVDLETIAQGNIDKLQRRYPDGFTVGGGVR